MPRLPEIISFTMPTGRPRISARSVCVHPRSSSSSRRNSPGGNTSAGRRAAIGILPSRSVVVFDSDNLHPLVTTVTLELQDEPELVVEAHGPLVLTLPFQLLEVQRLQAVEVPLVGSGTDELE